MARHLLLVACLGMIACDDDYLLPAASDAGRVDAVLALEGDPDAGALAFEQHQCSVCHDPAGLEKGAGPALALSVPALTDAYIVDIILHGRGSMPASLDVDDPTCADLLAWLRATFPAE